MPNPRVTVVIPCWNDGRFLNDAIGSALSQDVPARVVVVDDGSTDPLTRRAIAELDDDRVMVVRQQNAGVARARTAGLRAADTEFVFALDADDMLADNVLGALLEALEGNADLGAAWGDLTAFGTSSYVNPTWRTLDPWFVTYVNRIPVSALYRRSALDEVGGWTLDDGYEDWDLWMALAYRGWSGIHIGRPHLWYRQHDDPGRGLARDRARHEAVLETLRERHRELFMARRSTRADSIAPPAVQSVFPLIERIPVGGGHRRERLLDLALRLLMPSMRPIIDGRRQSGPVGGLVRRVGNRVRHPRT